MRREALAQTFRAQLNAYTKALINSAVAKWAATKQFIKNIFVKSPKKQIALKAVENSEVREVVEKGAKGSSVGVEAGTAEFIETGHKISSTSNGVISAGKSSLKVGVGGDKVWEPIFRWGNNAEKASKASQSLTKAGINRIKNAGVTLEVVNEWKDFYLKVINKGGGLNKTAIERSNYMQKIIDIW